jgi:hypothetical protein
MELPPLGVLWGAFGAIPLPVGDPLTVNAAVFNGEMGCDTVLEIFLDAIAAVRIKARVGAAPFPNLGSGIRVVHSD